MKKRGSDAASAKNAPLGDIFFERIDDLLRTQSLGIKSENLIVHLRQPHLILAHQQRLEQTVPVMQIQNLNFDMLTLKAIGGGTVAGIAIS